MSTIAGLGIIGPTGERLSTTAASPAEVQRLTTPARLTPSAEPTSATASREGVRVTLSEAPARAGSATTTTSSSDPASSATSYAAQLAQKRYLQNSSSPSESAGIAQMMARRSPITS